MAVMVVVVVGGSDDYGGVKQGLWLCITDPVICRLVIMGDGVT